MTEAKRHDAIAGDIVHEYDGIEEADNELPTWWLGVFIGTILFAAGYWLVYHEYRLAPSPAEELAIIEAEQRRRAGTVNDEDLVAASKDTAQVALGKQVYTTNCLACHLDRGQGNIGPNLTDAYWLHGGAPMEIFGVIKQGVPAKGMPGWGPILGDGALKNVVAYLLTLRNTNVPGKPPQGEVWAGN